METLLDFTASPLTFHITLGQQAATQLVLTNVHSYPVAYKVKTTHIKRYCVRPNAAILSPKETLTVEVLQQAFRSPPPELEKCSDRFLLQAVSLKHVPDLPPNSTVTTVWEHAAAPAIQKAKFHVEIHLAATPPPLPSAPPPTLPPPPTVPQAAPNPPAPAVPSATATFPPAPPTRSPPLPPSPPNTSPLPPPPPTIPTPPPATKPTTPSSPQPAPTQKVAPPLPPPSLKSPLPNLKSPPPLVSSTTPPTVLPSPTTPAPPLTTEAPPPADPEIDYNSTSYIRSRALGVRPAPKVIPVALDRAARQRVAVERAAELARIITERQKEIDETKDQLTEARHKLSDAQLATRPAYDVRYQIDESATAPIARLCVMVLLTMFVIPLFF